MSSLSDHEICPHTTSLFGFHPELKIHVASGFFFKVILKCCDLSKPEQIKPKLTSTQCLKMYKQRQIEQTEPKMPDFNEVQMTKDKITRSDINILFTQCQDNKPCL